MPAVGLETVPQGDLSNRHIAGLGLFATFNASARRGGPPMPNMGRMPTIRSARIAHGRQCLIHS
jgi:hypothetical protein